MGKITHIPDISCIVEMQITRPIESQPCRIESYSLNLISLNCGIKMWILRWLAVLLGSLSIVKLIQYGILHEDFEKPLQLLLLWYDAFLDVLFGWAEPFIEGFLSYLLKWAELNIVLQDYWKHIFVLIWLYSGSQARNAWLAGHKRLSFFRAGWGGLAALLSSVIAGTIPVEGAVINAFLPLSTVFGIALYQFSNNIWVHNIWHNDSESYWPGMRYNKRHPLYYVLVGIPISCIGFFFPPKQIDIPIPRAGISLLLIFVVILTGYWLLQGAWWSRKQKSQSISFWKRFLAQPTTRQGLIMSYTLIGTLIFLLINAGLVLFRQFNYSVT